MTLVQRPTPPQTMRPTDQMYGAIQNNDDPTRTCRCTDPEVHKLIDLINGGMDQAAASRLLWASTPALPRPSVGRPVARGLFGIGLRGDSR